MGKVDDNFITRLLLGAYVISTGFITLPVLPSVTEQLQVSELIFLGLFTHSFLIFIRKRNSISFSISQLNSVDYGVLVILNTYLISVLLHSSRQGYRELISIAYVCLLYAVIRFLMSFSTKQVIRAMTSALIGLGSIVALLGILGFVLALIYKGPILGLTFYLFYPYFGDIGRATAFTPSPALYVSVLAMPFFIVVAQLMKKGFSRNRVYLLILLILGLLLSLSKSVILLVCVVLIFISNERYLKRWMKVFVRITAFFGVLFYFLGSHFLLINKDLNNRMADVHYISNDVLVDLNERYHVVHTPYSFLKRASIAMWRENPLSGVGLGGFNQKLSEYKKQGKYPKPYLLFNPHSTLFGILGEMGIVGMIGLFTIMMAIARCSINLNSSDSPFYIAIQMLFLFMLFEIFTSDIMKFRHYWVIIAILASVKPNNKIN